VNESQRQRLLGAISGAVEALLRDGWTREEILEEVERDLDRASIDLADEGE
jgi:hypothetical protein